MKLPGDSDKQDKGVSHEMMQRSLQSQRRVVKRVGVLEDRVEAIDLKLATPTETPLALPPSPRQLALPPSKEEPPEPTPVESDEDLHEVQTELQNFTEIRDSLIDKYGDPASASLEWIAQNMIDLDPAKVASMHKLIDVLEEDDDVQNFYTNAIIPDEE